METIELKKIDDKLLSRFMKKTTNKGIKKRLFSKIKKITD